MCFIRSYLAYWYLRWARKPWSRVVRHLIEKNTGELPAVATVADVRNALNEIVWTKDKWIDYISFPKHIYRTKKGDCDDYSVLGCALLAKIKINAAILSVIVADAKKSHAICIFWDGPDLCFFDNARYGVQPRGERNILSIVDRIARGSKALAWSIEDYEGNIIRVKRGR